MDGRSYITALFDDRNAAAAGIQVLASQGVLPDEVCAAIADNRALLEFCNQTGAIPLEGPIAPQLREVGVSVERAADAERRIASGCVMLLLPAALHADERLHALRELDADALCEPSDETLSIPMRAERLNVRKRYVSDAEVRVRKIVRTVTQHIDVPLMREEVVVMRTAPGKDTEVLRIPTKHEEIELHKRTVVTNEVTVRRESAESVAHVSEPLRHEELEIHHIDSSTGDRTSTFAATNCGKSSGSRSETTESSSDMDDASNTIRAFFPDRESADAAADELRASGVDDGNVTVQSAEGGGFLDGVKRFFGGEELDRNGDGAVLVVERADRETLEPILGRYGGRIAEADMQSGGGTMKLHEERLNVTTHPEQEGEVRLTKDVETRQEEIDVPVKREEVVLTRRRLDEPEDQAELGEGEEVRIPVLRDEVDVQKDVVTTEEVGVEKRPVEETQHVSASLQKERARLETDGHVGTTLNDE